MEFKTKINLTYKGKTYTAWMVYSADLETIRDIEKSFSSPYISNIVEYKEEVKETEEPKKTLKSKKK